MKIRELLKLNIDVDVSNDYSDEFTDDCGNEGFPAVIAFCGPGKLTEEGEKYFARCLNFDIDVDENCVVVHIPEGNNEQMEKDNTLVMMLFYGLSGNVPESYYNKYFKDY